MYYSDKAKRALSKYIAICNVKKYKLSLNQVRYKEISYKPFNFLSFLRSLGIKNAYSQIFF